MAGFVLGTIPTLGYFNFNDVVPVVFVFVVYLQIAGIVMMVLLALLDRAFGSRNRGDSKPFDFSAWRARRLNNSGS